MSLMRELCRRVKREFLPCMRTTAEVGRSKRMTKQEATVIEMYTGVCMLAGDDRKYFYDFVDYDCGVMTPWSDVDRWKPLGLPTDVNERVLVEIEKWFEYH